MKTLILVNTLQNINQFIYSNHIEFFTKTRKLYPKDDFFFFTPPRMSIDRARNQAAKMALESECDNLLFIDDDVLVPQDCFKKLIETEGDIISGLVIIRGWPFNVMAFKETGDGQLDFFNDLPKDSNNKLKELVSNEDKLGAVGFSCCLIKVDLLKSMNPPFFVTGPHSTEDIYFCCRALSELSPTPKIVLNTSIRCGHFLHPEAIEWDSRDRFIEFYREIGEAEDKAKKEAVRNKHDLAYIRRALTSLEGQKDESRAS